MMARVMPESPVSPSSLSVPVQTFLSGQGAQTYFAIGTHPKISSGSSAFLRFGSLSLNPHAEEFVPSSLKVGSTSIEDLPSLIKSTTVSLEPYMERRISNDEYRQYVCSQLPDDILPDFNCPSQASAECEQPPDAADVTSDVIQTCSFKSDCGYVENAEQILHQRAMKFHASIGETANYTPYNPMNDSSYVLKSQQSASINQLQSASINQLSFSQRATRPGFYKDLSNRPVLNDPAATQSLNILASKFPNITVQNLADKFSANADDLGLTLNNFTQLELQEGSISHHSQLSAAAAPYMSVTNLPSPSSFKSVIRPPQYHEDANNIPVHMDSHANVSSSYLQHSARRGMGMFPGPLKPSHSSGEVRFMLDSKGSGQEGIDRNIGRELSRWGRQAWLEMGDAVANTMEKLDKEPDHARMSNAYYEHARQAHLAGKLGLAKELNAKGQWHMQQIKKENFKASDIFGRQNSCFVNMGHAAHQSLLRPRNVFIH